mmetsp:Transcript_29009/g.81708  ORF Transcript_29009/g.81708 Transcript_29009/m.81708 type:complete len:216 (-) Transcript_29009:405-1052(-)
MHSAGVRRHSRQGRGAAAATAPPLSRRAGSFEGELFGGGLEDGDQADCAAKGAQCRGRERRERLDGAVAAAESCGELLADAEEGVCGTAAVVLRIQRCRLRRHHSECVTEPFGQMGQRIRSHSFAASCAEFVGYAGRNDGQSCSLKDGVVCGRVHQYPSRKQAEQVSPPHSLPAPSTRPLPYPACSVHHTVFGVAVNSEHLILGGDPGCPSLSVS